VTSTTSAATAGRGPLLRHPWRWAIVALVVVVVLNLVFVALDESDTSPGGRTLPSTIDGLTPAPGELVRLQDTIGADLRDDLTGVLVLDRQEIPEDQLDRVVPLAEVSFRPGPDKDLERFEPGVHTLTVLYWPQGKARPAKPGSYSWSFRAGA
jgi:hypothetical protein